ncbi:MAG: L-threonylcarbamoyladenylate synthase [Lentisphaerae bacterium]|jgi:L-threonylcarbamoyladenylate synthase|nr:L-threonylcarbamoyladenylate synthase [Lentisphaerota bacterium]
MQTIQVNSAAAYLTSREILCSLGVAIVPTETVYGLVTLWGNLPGRERIYTLKRRPADKRLQMLAADLSQAERAGVIISCGLEKIARAFWPGPLTVVVPARDGDSIGLRLPAYQFLQRLLLALPEPLAATSANLSGQPPAASAAAALAGLQGQPDLLVDGGVVSSTAGAASTVLSLLQEQPVILRPGPISLEEILAVWQ